MKRYYFKAALALAVILTILTVGMAVSAQETLKKSHRSVGDWFIGRGISEGGGRQPDPLLAEGFSGERQGGQLAARSRG